MEVVTQKYQDHLPLERQVRIMAREGIKVDSQTLWDQVWALACLLKPVYKKLLIHVKSQRLILADETPIYLLKKGGKAKWYVWGLATADAVYFHVDPSRGAEVARRLLAGYRGTVITDGYCVYVSLDKTPVADADILWANCWSHSRRKYVECELSRGPSRQGQRARPRRRRASSCAMSCLGRSSSRSKSGRRSRSCCPARRCASLSST